MKRTAQIIAAAITAQLHLCTGIPATGTVTYHQGGNAYTAAYSPAGGLTLNADIRSGK